VGFFAGAALWGLSIQRGTKDEPFAPAEARLLATLSDRLTEVATLSAAVGHVALSSMIRTLDGVDQAAVAVDRNGAVVEANGGSERILDSDLYIDACGRLRTPDARAGAALQTFFDRLLATPDGKPARGGPIVVRRNRKGPVVVRVLSIPAEACAPFGGARALLTLSSTEPKPGPDAQLISDVFGLTRAEAAVAAMVAQGKSLAAIADTRGIARVTVRNQIKTIFAKTGVHRQSELAALLSRL
jgi:DNA-binding CsgD family transcriptional regulator